MTLYDLQNGNLADADEVIANTNTALTIQLINLARQIQDRSITFGKALLDAWGESYTDSNGRMNSVNTSQTSAEFDTDKYKTSSGPYVIIVATSISSISDFSINNCAIVNISSGEWQLICNSGTDEVKRAQIYKTLFYGTDGTNPRASATYITGLTALKTSVSRDVGKIPNTITFNKSYTISGSIYSARYSYTFSNTSTNNNASFWANVPNPGRGSTRLEVPSKTTLASNVNEIGTDTTSDEIDNPATMQIELTSGDTSGNFSNHSVFVIALIEGTTGSYVYDFTGADQGEATVSQNTYITLTNGSGENIISKITHTIPPGTFPSNISSAILAPHVADWEDGAGISFKFTNTGGDDSGWLSAIDTTNNVAQIQKFTAFSNGEPDTLQIRLEPKSSSPAAGVPSMYGFGVIAK